MRDLPTPDVPSLIENEERLRAIFSAMSEGLVIHGLDGCISDANPAAEHVLQCSRAQLIGKHPKDFEATTVRENGTDLPASEHPALITLTTHRAIRDYIMGIRASDGEVRWISVNSQPVFSSGDEELVAVVATFVDITARKRQELAIAEQNALLERALSVKDQFLAGMSHELRTPLTAVIGFAQLLYAGQLDSDLAKAREFMGHIVDSGMHLLRLVDDLLDLAKMQEGKFDWHQELVSLSDVIAEVTAAFQLLAGKKHIVIETIVSDDFKTIQLDASRLRQVLFNYISNAIKFTPEGGSVTLRVYRSHESLCIEVEDTGVGIDDPNVPRLFKEFEQLDASAARVYGGAGLGLALTRRIVEAQGGSVEVNSRVGAGSTFRALIPLQSGDPPSVRSDH